MSAAEQLEPIDMVIRPVAGDELNFVRASWGRLTWARGESSVAVYDSHARVDVKNPDGFVSLGPSRSTYSRHETEALLSARHHVLFGARDLADMHRAFIDVVLANPETCVAIASLPDLPEPMGWACWTGPRLHYVFVRDNCRKQRVATRLVHYSGCSAASHVTPSGRALLRHLHGGG